MSDIYLKCIEYGKKYKEEEKRVFCDCGGLLQLEFNPIFNVKKIKNRDKNLWRYRELVPINNDDNIISLKEGFTPLVEYKINGYKIFLKLEFIFPTGSFKDRGATVLISKVKELGIKRIVEDSSGNAGASIAAYSAVAKIECDIFVPENASPNKIKQIEFYGANLHKISGSREEVFNRAKEFSKNFYYASHFVNPYFFHGTKSVIYEIFEDFNYSLPDTIILPVGSGSFILGIYIGLNDLKRSGLIRKFPKLIGVQSENCAPIHKAFIKKELSIQKFEKKQTIAEGISNSNPLRGKEILKAIYESEGDCLIVSDEEIILSQKELGKSGIFVEPTSAASYAGTKKYIKNLKKEEKIVVILTGSGLKSL